MVRPSTVAPLAMLRTTPSDRRVSRYCPAVAGSGSSRYSLASSCDASAMASDTEVTKLPDTSRTLPEAGSACGAPKENSGAPVPGGLRRSRPSACWALMVDAAAAARRPSALRAAVRSSFWKRSSPPTDPPASSDGGSVRRKPCSSMARAMRDTSYSSGTTASVAACCPSTRRCPPARNTPTLPSLASSVVTCTRPLSSRTSWSRWSSRSLGG